MALREIYDACAAVGYRVNEEAGTVDGVCHGIAFRLMPQEGTLDLSMNISADNLEKLRGLFGTNGHVDYHGSGVRLSAAGVDQMMGDAAVGYIDGWTEVASNLAGASFEDTFSSYREPVAAYVRGVLGGLLGAVAGMALWSLVGLLGVRFWFLGALISVGAFYGYQWLRGAHATGFAIGVIVVCSLLAVLGGQVLENAIFLVMNSDTPITFWQALGFYLTPSGLVAVLRSSVYAFLACALGFVGIRGKVLMYTHETTFLRRKK